MTAALKEAAVLRSLADQVASPVVAGRKSRKALTSKQRSQWQSITNFVVDELDVAGRFDDPVFQANLWHHKCKTAGIGAGLLGWFFWNWAFPLLLELAKLWIESRKKQQD